MTTLSLANSNKNALSIGEDILLLILPQDVYERSG